MNKVMKKVIGMIQPIMSRGWVLCKKYENIYIFLSLSIITLFIVLIAIMLSFSAEEYFADLTEISYKPELLKFIGWGISGLIAVLVAVGILQRTTVLDKQNKITKEGHDQRAIESDKQNEMTEKGHIHERFKAAIDHLGNKESISVRIAAFNEFYRLAELDPESGLQKTIFGILCAHLRQTTKDENYQKKERAEVANLEKNKLTDTGSDIKKTKEIKPTEEVQSLLDILFKPNNENKLIFGDIDANLEGVYLHGANLQSANLQGANLEEANLKKAKLQNAKLQKANLKKANLQQACMDNAYLQKAELQNANMGGAFMKGADMKGADLQEAKLQEAVLQNAILQNANMEQADMKGAYLQRADLKYAILWLVCLQNAYLQHANLEKADLYGAQLQGANLSRTCLYEVNLHEANLQGATMLSAKLQGAKFFNTTINKKTTLPYNWKDIIERHGDDSTCVSFVDDEGNVIKHL